MNTSKLATFALLTLAVAQFTGCAMMKKTGASASASSPASVSENVHIQSTPSGATVSINGNDVGVTPLVTVLDPSQTYIMGVKQAGFYYYTQTLKAEAAASSPAQFPPELSVTLAPVQDSFHALEVAVAKLDDQLATHQISPEAYKQQLPEVTGLYH